MAFSHGTAGRVFLNERHLSASLRSFTTNWQMNYGETTSLMDSGGRYLPGLQEGQISLDGHFESIAVTGGNYEELISTVQGVDNAVMSTILPVGYGTIGNPAFIANGDASSYEIEASVDDRVGFKYEHKADNAPDWGVSLSDFTAKTATANGTSVDNTVGTTNGGVASLHVVTVSGTTPTCTFKVQHSTDNISFTDLITFTAVGSTATSEYKTVSGTVNRYVRAQYTIAGTSPSYTFAMAFARR